MPSQLSWLDYSPSEQKRVRELLRLFEDVDTRDELGTGQVRDAFSDLLFPGMSVLLTRARYLLFVPWCYPVPDGANIEKVRGVGDRNERRLIVTMHNQGDRDGLIGGRAGTAVKILPSTIYGTALRTFGIQQAELGDLPASLDAAADEATELTGRRAGYWHRSVPPVPAGFPTAVEGGFELTPHEAEFLRARVAGGAAGRILAYIVIHATDDVIRTAPWSDPSAALASAAVQETFGWPRTSRSSTTGLPCSYNLVVAERHEAEGLTKVADWSTCTGWLTTPWLTSSQAPLADDVRRDPDRYRADQPLDQGATRDAFPAASGTPEVGATTRRQACAARLAFETLGRHDQTELVKSAERGQIRTSPQAE